MVETVNGITSATQTASSVASNKLQNDYKSFLTLLTAQLTNQDPLEPMDSSTFVTQLAQLSQVEQSIQTNSYLESIASRLYNSGLTNDLGLIGREVSVPGKLFDLISGKGSFDYVLDTAAQDVKALIKNSAGVTVAELDGLATDGATLHSVPWNGLTSEGQKAEDGIYEVEIVATDAEGEAVEAEPYTKSTVERLTLQAGQSLLHLSNGETALAMLVASVE
jgi:flagellar basal-body rod modification protein FlgD